jgi:uncharacterized protein (UPF0179 family)
MVGEKSKITLIGTTLARPGLEFVYQGALDACGSCKVRKACNNLRVGRKYRILSVRNTRHDCQVHLNGASAVECVESPVVALIGADMAIVNSRILFECACTRTECKDYDLCRPDGIVEGDRYLVGEVLGNPPAPCEKGRSLKLVELRPIG